MDESLEKISENSGITMQIIGLCGKLGSGKTTAQKYIIKQYNFIPVNLADALKRCAEILERTSRQDLQTLGGGFRTLFGQDFWVRILEERIKKQSFGLPESMQRFVVGDVRYVNEAEWIQQNGGFVIGIDTSFDLRYVRVYERANIHDKQPTQEDFRLWDGADTENHVNYIIYNMSRFRLGNNSTLEKLYSDIDFIFSLLHQNQETPSP